MTSDSTAATSLVFFALDVAVVASAVEVAPRVVFKAEVILNKVRVLL